MEVDQFAKIRLMQEVQFGDDPLRNMWMIRVILNTCKTNNK